MASINLIFQGKGGVGKSYVASLLAQYYATKGVPLACYDTDPVNRTFAGYASFEAETVKLGERADEINPRYFDALIEQIIAAPAAGAVVIDNGASTFLPLLGYMVEVDALGALRDAGHSIRLHAVVTGGQALMDTMQGLDQLFSNLPDDPVVVWLNEYFGRVGRRVNGGDIEGFESSAMYRKNKKRIHALVRLPEVRKETFGHDIENMLRARLTFDEALASPEFPIMARQRLKQTWRTLNAAMDRANL